MNTRGDSKPFHFREGTMKTCRTIGVIFIVFLFAFGCEENSPTKNSKKFIPKISDLVGTYQMTSYKILFHEDNTTITDQTPGITMSGIMTISKEARVVGTITVNGEADAYTTTITQIKNDSVMTWTLGQQSEDVHYKFDNVNLTLRFEGEDEKYGLFTETETWHRTSLVVQKRSVVKVSKFHDLIEMVSKLKK